MKEITPFKMKSRKYTQIAFVSEYMKETQYHRRIDLSLSLDYFIFDGKDYWSISDSTKFQNSPLREISFDDFLNEQFGI